VHYRWTYRNGNTEYSRRVVESMYNLVGANIVEFHVPTTNKIIRSFL